MRKLASLSTLNDSPYIAWGDDAVKRLEMRLNSKLRLLRVSIRYLTKKFIIKVSVLPYLTILNCWAATLLVGSLVANPIVALGGDSVYGVVTEIRSAIVMTVSYGSGSFSIQLSGIEVPECGSFTKSAATYLENTVLHKNVRIRFDQRTASGEMASQMYTGNSKENRKLRNVGVDLVRLGYALPLKNYEDNYGEYAKAEVEAREHQRGIWATDCPK